jgi:putative membrane protein
MTPPPPWPELLIRFAFDPLAIAALGAAAILYLRAARRISGTWPARRTRSFVSGLIVVAVATLSGIGRFDTERFSVHSVQHVLLGMVAPVLIMAGAPVTLSLRVGSATTRRRVAAIAGSGMVRTLTDPITVGTLFTATLYALYLTPLYRLTTTIAAAHVLLHMHLLLLGCLYASSILGFDHLTRSRSTGLRLLVIAIGVPAHTLLGVVVLAQQHLLVNGRWDDLAQLGDQHQGAGVLLIAGELFGLACAAIVFAEWIRRETRSSALEAHLARGTAP